MVGTAQKDPQTKKEVLARTGNCTTNSDEIIGSQEDDFVKIFLKSGFDGDFIGTFGTTVHECLHGYDSDLADGLEWDNNTYPIAYFVDKGIVVRFAGKRLFKTEELHKEFFSKDVKNLFRYGTYVQANSGPSTASSNQWGIYGLIEEFNAYYHDVRAQVEYFKCNSYQGPSDETFGNTMHAYFEFNIFMANYLKYAKVYHKEDYDYMMKNHDLRLAYTLIEYNWRNVLTEIMGDKDLANRMPGYDEEFRLYTEELQGVMNDFMVSESELTDYKDFLSKRPSDMKVVAENKAWAEQMNLTGFGAGMNADEMTEMYEGFDNLELNFEEKDPEKHYVVILTTKSEEELMDAIFKNFPAFKKIGIIMDYELNFSVYLDKFSSRAKAEKMAKEVEKDFPGVKVI
ncbi:hypothetical protein [Parvicella tangerina]|nr:hypothetical protein [Parvicella tangerina]